MRKLISANVVRLRKDKMFWLCLSASILLFGLVMLNGIRRAAAHPELSDYCIMDRYFFHPSPFLGGVIAAFSSLFLGTDYSDGTIRNKLIAGHSRVRVYLSALAVSAMAAVIFAAAGMLCSLAGLAYFGGFAMGWKQAAVYVVIVLLSAVAISALLTAFQMAIPNKAVSVVVSFAVFLALLFLGSYLYNALCEPDIISPVVLTADGIVMSDPQPNPDYIGGVTREIFLFLAHTIPTGQQILVVQSEVSHPALCLLASLVLTAASTAAGAWLFRKKDLK